MEPVDDIAQSAPLGELLARERERLGLSRSEIAQRLHMSASQVEALELGDYEHLPKGTFLRGFVRNYAKQLGMPADPLLSRLQEVAPRPPSPGIVVPSQNIRFDPMHERLASPYVKAGVFAVFAIAMALAAMYWWLFVRPAPPAAVTRKSVELGPPQQIAAAPVSAPEAPAPRDAPKAEAPRPEAPAAEKQNGNPMGVAPVTPTPALPHATFHSPGARGGGSSANAPPAGASAPSAPVKAARGERTLKFRFKGESWVEVRDAQGRILLSRLNAAGSQAEVAGRPPLGVVVGNAPEVQVLSDDRNFPLEPHTKVAVARFTVE